MGANWVSLVNGRVPGESQSQLAEHKVIVTLPPRSQLGKSSLDDSVSVDLLYEHVM